MEFQANHSLMTRDLKKDVLTRNEQVAPTLTARPLMASGTHYLSPATRWSQSLIVLYDAAYSNHLLW